jgi:hypothetical protein
MLSFKDFILISESVEENFDDWMEAIKGYAKPNEAALKSISVTPQQKKLIIEALKSKQKENQDYLKLLLGVLSTKPDARIEDLTAAIDLVARALREKKPDGEPYLTRQQIAGEGWYNLGNRALKDITELLAKPETRSSIIKSKKKLNSIEQAPMYDKNGIKIYYFPLIGDLDEKEIERRHKLLCKYGVGTSWCTAQPSWDAHRSYTWQPIYIVHVDDNPVYQWVDGRASENRQFMDVKDRTVYGVMERIHDAIGEAGLQDTIKHYNLKSFPELDKFDKMSSNEKISLVTSLFDKDEINFKKYWDHLSEREKESIIKSPWISSKERVAHTISFLLKSGALDALDMAKKTYKNIDLKILKALDGFYSFGAIITESPPEAVRYIMKVLYEVMGNLYEQPAKYSKFRKRLSDKATNMALRLLTNDEDSYEKFIALAPIINFRKLADSGVSEHAKFSVDNILKFLRSGLAHDVELPSKFYRLVVKNFVLRNNWDALLKFKPFMTEELIKYAINQANSLHKFNLAAKIADEFDMGSEPIKPQALDAVGTHKFLKNNNQNDIAAFLKMVQKMPELLDMDKDELKYLVGQIILSIMEPRAGHRIFFDNSNVEVFRVIFDAYKRKVDSTQDYMSHINNIESALSYIMRSHPEITKTEEEVYDMAVETLKYFKDKKQQQWDHIIGR